METTDRSGQHDEPDIDRQLEGGEGPSGDERPGGDAEAAGSVEERKAVARDLAAPEDATGAGDDAEPLDEST